MFDAFKTNGSSRPADITGQNEGSIFILRGPALYADGGGQG